MKKYYIYLFIILLVSNINAEITVKSFRKLESDMTARIDAPKTDQNGDACAIIKVVTTQTGFGWEPDGLGIIAAETKLGEYWLYVPFGAKRLTIKHAQLGVLRDYMYPLPIEKACVYELVLTSGRVETTVVEEITSLWLLIHAEPEKAMIYLNDQFVKTGEYQAKLKPGSYTYRVEMPLYHPEAGKIEIKDAKKELNISLKPAFGNLNIVTTPETGAMILIDGKEQTATTPCQTENLASGEHTVQVIKEMFQSITKKVNVNDGIITPLSFILQPNFAELSITSDPEAMIYVNNQQKGIGIWNGRLNPGIYSLEVRLDKHRSVKQDIELVIGEKKSYDLRPTPIYGALDIMTTPAGAKIIIDGKSYGTTPNTINNLLIGKYQVQLIKNGFTTLNKNITIFESKSTEIIDSLNEGQTEIDTNLGPVSLKNGIRFSSMPTKAYILENGTLIGVTPFETDQLTDGEYNFEIRQENKVSRTIKVTVNKRIYANYLINLNEEVPKIIYGFNPIKTDSGYGNIIVSSNPYGEKVFLDGIFMNTTPCQISDIKSGEHLLEIKFANYPSRKRIIQVKSDNLESYEF